MLQIPSFSLSCLFNLIRFCLEHHLFVSVVHLSVLSYALPIVLRIVGFKLVFCQTLVLHVDFSLNAAVLQVVHLLGLRPLFELRGKRYHRVPHGLPVDELVLPILLRVASFFRPLVLRTSQLLVSLLNFSLVNLNDLPLLL